MNVASLELCKELSELSGWQPDPDETAWFESSADERSVKLVTSYGVVPAYGLGYLLRKLPPQLRTGGLFWLGSTVGGRWSCGYRGTLYKQGDTPENAVVKLAIELFKQKVLTKEVS